MNIIWRIDTLARSLKINNKQKLQSERIGTKHLPQLIRRRWIQWYQVPLLVLLVSLINDRVSPPSKGYTAASQWIHCGGTYWSERFSRLNLSLISSGLSLFSSLLKRERVLYSGCFLLLSAAELASVFSAVPPLHSAILLLMTRLNITWMILKLIIIILKKL